MADVNVLMRYSEHPQVRAISFVRSTPEKLQANALKIGDRILARLEHLQPKYNLIGDVRGKGLLPGNELVKDRGTKKPATDECAQVLENCRDMGLLLGKGGLQGQTI